MFSSTCFVLLTLLVRLNAEVHETNGETNFNNETIASENGSEGFTNKNATEGLRNSKEKDKISDEVWKIASSVLSYAEERLKAENGDLEAVKDFFEDRGLKLKYKKAELQFFMKAFMAMKVFLGIILPLGIIAAKVLSWKALTLSLMSFMLAKILLVKNLVTSKNSFSGNSANFIPPVLIQSAANDLFWKRQGDLNGAYTWTPS